MEYVMLSLLLSSVLFAKSGDIVTAWPELEISGSGTLHPNDVALIVSIEDYAYVPNVRGANKNAADWQKYFSEKQGIPPANIQWLQNGEATKEKLQSAVLTATEKTKSGGQLWFVFIGHGAPAIEGDDGVLVLADVQQDPESLYARSLSQEWVLKNLEMGKQQDTIVILDACFSGQLEGSKALAEGLQPLIATEDLYTGNTTVLSAGTHDQFAGPLPGSLPYADRPAFSYLTLGAMMGWGDSNKDEVVTVQEVIDYNNHALSSTLVGRKQTPRFFGEKPDLILGKGQSQSPDFGEIQRVSKDLLVKRSELLAKGKTGEPVLRLTRKSKLSYSGAVAVAVVGSYFISNAQKTQSDVYDLTKTQDPQNLTNEDKQERDRLAEQGMREQAIGWSFVGTAGVAAALGFYYMF